MAGLSCLRHRQPNTDQGAFSFLALDQQLPTVAIDDVFHDGQPQPGSPHRTRTAFVSTVEPLGQAGKMLPGDARALIADRHDDAPPARPTSAGHRKTDIHAQYTT